VPGSARFISRKNLKAKNSANKDAVSNASQKKYSSDRTGALPQPSDTELPTLVASLFAVASAANPVVGEKARRGMSTAAESEQKRRGLGNKSSNDMAFFPYGVIMGFVFLLKPFLGSVKTPSSIKTSIFLYRLGLNWLCKRGAS
jgi:hypothetical protein